MLVYLKPMSIFPQLHSDTLFGALTSAISELYPEKVDEMLKEFEIKPPFLISSTFPFIFKEDKKIRFYPKPIFKEYLDVSLEQHKKYKGVSYLEETIFFNLIKGKVSEYDIVSNIEDYNKIKNLLTFEEYNIKVDYTETVLPNNSVNRYTNEAKIFYSSGGEYKNLGLFFIIEFINKDYEEIVKSAIRFLKDRGFGKDISTGKGQFDYEIDEDFKLPYDDSDLDSFITLSRFIPNKDDLDNIGEYSSYEIGSKRGKSRSGEPRKQVRFFNEGSIFKEYSDYYGQIVVSGLTSPAVEYGFAFTLKCKGNLEG